MIFAELVYEEEYAAIHARLVSLLGKKFPQIESGLQGDSWIWILEGTEKVVVDTFSSMKHQVKSTKQGSLVQAVIETLQTDYKVTIYEEPRLEEYEGN